MDSVRERDSPAPAEADDAVLLLRGRQRHPVLCDCVQLSLNPCRIERPDGCDCEWSQSTVGHVREILHGEEIRRDGNEAVGGKLVGYASDPGRQPINLVDD
jgi:hypothetical protein